MRWTPYDEAKFWFGLAWVGLGLAVWACAWLGG